MELWELYRLIALPPEITSRLEETGAALALEPLERCLEGMLDRETAERAYGQLREALGEDPDSLRMLYCQLECARRAWDKYRERRIPKSVYCDTMRCFPRFLAECLRKNGRMFFDRGWWTWRQTGMRLFRVGALEYELREGADGNTIALHIPSDADFSPAAVDDSLERADVFFREFYPDFPYDGYTCHSWLLSPALGPLLPEGSHILSFQKRFSILEADSGDREFMEWLFQAPAGADWRELSAVTHLQRAVKEMLRGGGTVGSAYGRMREGRPGKSEGAKDD